MKKVDKDQEKNIPIMGTGVCGKTMYPLREHRSFKHTLNWDSLYKFVKIHVLYALVKINAHGDQVILTDPKTDLSDSPHSPLTPLSEPPNPPPPPPPPQSRTNNIFFIYIYITYY